MPKGNKKVLGNTAPRGTMKARVLPAAPPYVKLITLVEVPGYCDRPQPSNTESSIAGEARKKDFLSKSIPWGAGWCPRRRPRTHGDLTQTRALVRPNEGTGQSTVRSQVIAASAGLQIGQASKQYEMNNVEVAPPKNMSPASSHSPWIWPVKEATDGNCQLRAKKCYNWRWRSCSGSCPLRMEGHSGCCLESVHWNVDTGLNFFSPSLVGRNVLFVCLFWACLFIFCQLRCSLSGDRHA